MNWSLHRGISPWNNRIAGPTEGVEGVWVITLDNIYYSSLTSSHTTAEAVVCEWTKQAGSRGSIVPEGTFPAVHRFTFIAHSMSK